MTEQIPTPGRVVHYKLTDNDAEVINRRRADAKLNYSAAMKAGTQIHVGNHVVAGEIYPAIIVRTWGNQPNSAVNLQVLLDGNDNYWATSRQAGVHEGSYGWPVRS